MSGKSTNGYGPLVPAIVVLVALAIALVAILAHLPALAGALAAGIVAAFFFLYLPFRRKSERGQQDRRP
jgi:hypothetical protein